MSANPSRSDAQIGSLIISALFVLVGIVTLYDTTGYSDRDSKVFPQTVAIILIVTSGASLVTGFLRPDTQGGFGTGIWWRRVVLVAAMFAASLLMPYIGFLPAGAIAFAGGLIAAMHDRWTARTAVYYCGSGVAIMAAFFGLFELVLNVPLP